MALAATLDLARVGASNGPSEPSFAHTLSGLPNELLIIIIYDLDNESLFNLGLTSRRMNTIALKRFFAKNEIRDPETEYFLSLEKKLDLPVQIVSALRSALYVRQLRIFEFVLGPGVERMREEVADLCVLAARLHTMNVFTLSFWHIDHRPFSDPAELQILAADGERWYKSVTGLLDNVLDRSCEELHVDGGTLFSELYLSRGLPPTPCRPSPVDERPTKLNKERRLVRLRMAFKSLRSLPTFKQKAVTSIPFHPQATGITTTEAVQLLKGNNTEINSSDIQPTNGQNADPKVSLVNSNQATQETPPRQRNLRAAWIRSDMLLHFPFSKWTLSALNAASSTLTTLTLEITVEADMTWKTFSGYLSLPLLKDFSLANNFYVPVNVAEFVDVEAFLINHPSIRDLHLYGVQLPPSLEAVPRPTFQNLVKFKGHPFYIVWVLKRLKPDKTALPNLERLVVSAEKYIAGTSFDYPLFERALEAVAESRRRFVLGFNFNCSCDLSDNKAIEDWLESHIRKGHAHHDRRTIFSRLSNISTLVIYNLWRLHNPDMLAIIPNWLQLFPGLRHLRFEQEVFLNEGRLVMDSDFVAGVAMLCPDLETMVASWVDEKEMRLHFSQECSHPQPIFGKLIMVWRGLHQ